MWLMRSHSYWPQNYSRVVFGCHVGGSDVISFSRTISPKTTKTTKRDDFGGKWQTSSRKKSATCLRALRCSSFWCAILYTKRGRKVWIYLFARTQSWFWTHALLRASGGARGILSFGFPRSSRCCCFQSSEEEKKLEKHPLAKEERTEEQRGGKREIYFFE